MAKLRVMVMRTPASKLPRDRMVNVFHLDTDPVGPDGVDYNALADDTLTLFNTHLLTFDTHPAWECRIYNMGDPVVDGSGNRIDRPPRTIRTLAGSGSGEMGPAEVALCLSFYSEFNRPRNRGRLYLGPFPRVYMTPDPREQVLAPAMAIGAGIANLGGVNVDWCVYSPTDNAYRKVTNYWVDNAWDTQRSRGMTATARRTATTSE